MERVQIDREKLAQFCREHRITRLALFGSVLRPDFSPDSDVDVLVQFAPDAHYGLLTVSRIQRELSRIFGREVDLVEWEAVERSRNYIRREAILGSLEVIYEDR
ncbi:MAG: nucleotidyltransferase family protein [Anaerolineae bacterium]